MAIESLAIFTENVATLDKSVKTIEDNTANQEIIKNSLGEIRTAAEKASDDLSSAERKYNSAIKLTVKDTERAIKDFAETTLTDLKFSRILLKESCLNRLARSKSSLR